MTAIAKIEANRNNGKLSTGPRTATGKAVAKLNAISHGLRSLSPVLPGERRRDWNNHRKEIVASLAPVGTFEAELVERVALLTWRMRRMVRYETASTAAGIANAVARVRGEKDDDNTLHSLLSSHPYSPRTYAVVRKELKSARESAQEFAATRDQFRQLPNLPAGHRFDGGDAFSLLLQVSGYTPNAATEVTDIEHAGFLAEIGIPEEWRNEPHWWDGWTAEIVRAGVKAIANDNGMTDAALLDRAVREADRTAGAEQRKAVELETELDQLAEETADAERVARGRALLPSAEVVDKVMRYESHLNKQLTQTLHQLERWQAIRSGNPPAPPAALDVTFEA